MTDAQRCRRNGWTVGTVLAGTEGLGQMHAICIRITAIGDEQILVRRILGDRHEGMESLGRLTDTSGTGWRKVKT